MLKYTSVFRTNTAHKKGHEEPRVAPSEHWTTVGRPSPRPLLGKCWKVLAARVAIKCAQTRVPDMLWG
jgi:hypothetical protein